MQRICVLGRGYLGRHLYDYLFNKLCDSHHVEILSIREINQLNLRNYDVLIDTADRASGVHDEFIKNKLEIIRGERNDSIIYIYFSSISIYDNIIKEIDDFSHVNPLNKYQINKIKNEKLIAENKQKTIILRLSNIWGIDSPRGTFIGDQVFNIKNKIEL